MPQDLIDRASLMCCLRIWLWIDGCSTTYKAKASQNTPISKELRVFQGHFEKHSWRKFNKMTVQTFPKRSRNFLLRAKFASTFEVGLLWESSWEGFLSKFIIRDFEIKSENLKFFKKKIWKSQLVELKKLENDIRVQIGL